MAGETELSPGEGSHARATVCRPDGFAPKFGLEPVLVEQTALYGFIA